VHNTARIDHAVNVDRWRKAQWVLAVAKSVEAASAVSQRYAGPSLGRVVSPAAVSTPSGTAGAPALAVPGSTGFVNGYPCGGPLPNCCTLRIESGGNPTAQNPHSSASGLWQFMHDTWAGYGGYSEAKYAPPEVQNQRAIEVFAGGAGWGNWKGDGCYPGG